MTFKAAFCLLAATFCIAHASASIFRVNNSLPTDVAQKLFNTVNEANLSVAVAAGDTLMIEGTTTIYPDATLTKPLVLIGPGYLLTQNGQTQASVAEALMGGITIEAGAAGTVLMGLTLSPGNSGYRINVEANNIIIMRCYMPLPIDLNGIRKNIFIVQNYCITSAVVANSSIDAFTDIVLKNNVIGGNVDIGNSLSLPRIFSLVENNIFLGDVELTTNTFRSNIIAKANATVDITSTNAQNNLVSNGQLPAAAGNVTFNPAQLFAGPTGNSPDGQYKLKGNSPYRTAGYGSAEPGIYGGSEPYVLSGLPPVPSIYELIADNFAARQTGLQVTIKAKSNQ